MKTLWKITTFLILLSLFNCDNPTTRLSPGKCKETPVSIQQRMNFILSCANVYVTTAPQMEQKEDIIDECSDHSRSLMIEECDKPTLEVYIKGDEFRNCAGIQNQPEKQVCDEAYKSYEQKGLIVY